MVKVPQGHGCDTRILGILDEREPLVDGLYFGVGGGV